jgi:radical SAM-linked protein
MNTEVRARARLTFAAEGPLMYVSVLDMGRLWERLLRRAGVPLAYTQGFNPHPRMQFATALPVGYSSECEVLDLLLSEELAPAALLAAIAPQCPPGLRVLSAELVPSGSPALQALVREADYVVDLWSPAEGAAVDSALAALLAREAIERQRIKKGKMATYDLRPLIHAVARTSSQDGKHRLHLVMACGPQGSGRPEDLIAELALEIDHFAIRRTALRWASDAEA